jgi:phytoene synthase
MKNQKNNELELKIKKENAKKQTIETHATDSDFHHCKSILKKKSKTFFFSSKVLPKDKEKAFWAVYAFCRKTDDIADEGNDPPNVRLENMAKWKKELLFSYKGAYSNDPIIRAFVETAIKYGIPKSYPLTLIRGVSSDIYHKNMLNFKELRDYCYSVASIVGIMLLKVMDVNSQKAKQHAIYLGIAMQLTNIIRDIAEDSMIGRVYLPIEDLKAHNLSPSHIKPNMPENKKDSFRKLIALQCQRARHYYHLSLSGISLIPKDLQLAIAMSASTYSRILDFVEKSKFEVFSQPEISDSLT